MLLLLLIILATVFFFLQSFCRKLKFFDSSVVSKVFLKKIFELCSRYWVFDFEIILILMPLLKYRSVKKQNSKKNAIRLVGLSSFKTVLYCWQKR